MKRSQVKILMKCPCAFILLCIIPWEDLWVDYELMTTIPGLYCLGEANFSDHGANRLGASALMQGLADGYFVIPYTVGNFLSDEIRTNKIPTDHPAFEKAEKSVSDRMTPA